jgi:hypothetical protein
MIFFQKPTFNPFWSRAYNARHKNGSRENGAAARTGGSGWLFGLGQATLNLDPPQRRSREPGSASGGLTGMQGLCQEFSSRDYTPGTMITLLTEVR